jgi:tripartite-type tricarboxylate transporter receptor subunit TctC
MTDLIAGTVNMSFAAAGSSIPHIKAGKIKPLAVTTVKRSPELPDVPTVQEAMGLQDYESNNWYGLVAPAKLPQPIVAKLHATLVATLAEPEIKAKLMTQGLEATPSPTPADFATYIAKEAEVWSRVVKASGAKVE